MALKLKNSWFYKGDDWWDWEAFIDDEGSGELSNVDYVEYVLHPTFPNPLRKITNPQGGFRLKTSGWGPFYLKAFVHYKDVGKKPEPLELLLNLYTDPMQGTSN
jgi:transcription initiation factor IIF auxiliary subunit